MPKADIKAVLGGITVGTSFASKGAPKVVSGKQSVAHCLIDAEEVDPFDRPGRREAALR